MLSGQICTQKMLCEHKTGYFSWYITSKNRIQALIILRFQFKDTVIPLRNFDTNDSVVAAYNGKQGEGEWVGEIVTQCVLTVFLQRLQSP